MKQLPVTIPPHVLGQVRAQIGVCDSAIKPLTCRAPIDRIVGNPHTGIRHIESNSKVVLIQNLYANFGKGDIEAIINMLADDVVWEEPEHPDIPCGGSRRGKPAVPEFFKAVGQVEVASFEPAEFIAGGDRVLAIGRWSGKVRSTGKSFKSEWVMSWTVRDGKVTQFRAYEDSAAVAAAFKK